MNAARLPLTAALLASACGVGSVTDGGSCPVEGEPTGDLERPRIRTPEVGAVDVDVAALGMRADFAPPPGDAGEAPAPVLLHYEIWLMAGSEPVQRVWTATTDGDEPAVTLEDGAFEDGFDGLDKGLVYTVRARQQTTTCQSRSRWSKRVRFRTADDTAYWFNDPPVRELRATISDESLAAMDAEALPDGCNPNPREYYPADLTLDGKTYPGVGARVKGGCGSARNLDEKAGMKFHVEWDDPNTPGCPAARTVADLERITLNNQVQDPSYLRDRLAYRFLDAMGLAALRTAPTDLYVNDEYFGLYLHVESIDRRFLSRHFESKLGMLYEGSAPGCDLTSEHMPADETGGTCFQKKFETDACDNPATGADPTTFDLLRQLTADLEALPDGQFYPAVTEILDWDNFLSAWAADAVLVQWDGYFYNRHNFRFYHEPTSDRWNLISHGYDQSFGFGINGSEPRAMDIFAPEAQLALRCLAEEACEAAFAARLREAATIFEELDLGTTASQIASEIRPKVEADPRKEHTLEDFDAAVQATLANIATRPDEVRAVLDERGL